MSLPLCEKSEKRYWIALHCTALHWIAMSFLLPSSNTLRERERGERQNERVLFWDDIYCAGVRNIYSPPSLPPIFSFFFVQYLTALSSLFLFFWRSSNNFDNFKQLPTSTSNSNNLLIIKLRRQRRTDHGRLQKVSRRRIEGYVMTRVLMCAYDVVAYAF